MICHCITQEERQFKIKILINKYAIIYSCHKRTKEETLHKNTDTMKHTVTAMKNRQETIWKLDFVQT